MSSWNAYMDSQYFSTVNKYYKIKSTRDVPLVDWELLFDASNCNKYDVSKILKKSRVSEGNKTGIVINDTVQYTPDIVEESKLDSPISELSYDTPELKNDSLPITDRQITQQDDVLFWSIISNIVCLDKDEGRMTNLSINLPHISKAHVMRMLHEKYFSELTQALIDVPLPFYDERINRNFMAHIIIKGKQFYNGILNNPDICLYLCDNYYPIYDWLSA
jgi:hypothetical protein